jgi:uncharacterized protein YdaT
VKEFLRYAALVTLFVAFSHTAIAVEVDIEFVDIFPPVESAESAENIENISNALKKALTVDKIKPRPLAEQIRDKEAKLKYYRNIKRKGIDAVVEQTAKQFGIRAEKAGNTMVNSSWNQLKEQIKSDAQKNGAKFVIDYVGTKKLKLAKEVVKNMKNSAEAISMVQDINRMSSDGEVITRELVEIVAVPLADAVGGAVMMAFDEIPDPFSEGSLFDRQITLMESDLAVLQEQANPFLSDTELSRRQYSLMDQDYRSSFDDFSNRFQSSIDLLAKAYPPVGSGAVCEGTVLCCANVDMRRTQCISTDKSPDQCDQERDAGRERCASGALE